MNAYDPKIECPGVMLDDDAVSETVALARRSLEHAMQEYFGSIQLDAGIKAGLGRVVTRLLLDFGADLARVISSAYTTQALEASRRSTATMLEALAAGAIAESRSPGSASGFAVVAAAAGLPEALEHVAAAAEAKPNGDH